MASWVVPQGSMYDCWALISRAPWEQLQAPCGPLLFSCH